MTRSQEAVAKKVTYVGAGECTICGLMKRDCSEIKKNWFTTIRICDSCGSLIFRSFRREVQGGA
ncbi:MAG: hypothetical protein KQH59_18085 [Desulfobulbaceae bacterium]|nr:hypothetical protein [Desulfobulbaceae bacterium]